MPWMAREETEEKKQSRNTRGMGDKTKDVAHYPTVRGGFDIHNDVSVVIRMTACH
jgi:hypothetical protein